MEPIVVPIASDIIASFTRGICPSSRMTPVFDAKPTNVPIVSNMFMKSKVKMMIAISIVKKPSKLNWQKVGARECGSDTGKKLSGISVTPNGTPIAVQIRIL